MNETTFHEKKKQNKTKNCVWVMLDEGNDNKIVFNWTKISPKIMDVVVPKWMIICWAQTKLGGKKMETRWRMMIMHAKHCRNGWIKD